MRLYVVWEEDRGAGEAILDVFTDVEEAKKLCGESAHYYMQEVVTNGIKPPLCDSLPDDKEIEFVASDESNGIDFNDLRYRSVWEEGFIKGAEWMKTRVK